MLRRLLSPAFLIPFGLALLVGGTKLGLIHYWSSDQPFSDQWAAEGGGVFRWRLGGAWEFSHYFFPHGEHTPALTRVIATGCALANSEQWDSRLEMLVSVAAHMLSALLVWQFAGLVLRGRWKVTVAAFAALVLALPSSYENFLWGFQTQFVFLIMFGLAHVLGTLREERLGASWWLAQVAGLFVLFSIASGVISAAVLAGLATLRAMQSPRSPWAWATLVINLLLVALGTWLLHRAFFAVERTTGLSLAFFSALGYLLSWPLPGPWLALVTQAPVGVLLWQTRGRWLELPTRVLVGLAFWAFGLAAAFAYGRGTGAGEIAVRYMDPLGLGLVANALGLAFLLARPARPVFASWLGGAWVLAIGAALAVENEPAKLRGNFEGQQEFFRRQQAAVSAYLVRNDVAELERDPLVRQYFPHFEQTRDILGDPLTRLALPESLAPSLALQCDPILSSPDATFRLLPASGANRRLLTLRGGVAGAIFVSRPIADDFRPVWRLRVSGRIGPGAAEIGLASEDGTLHLPLDRTFDATGSWKTVNLLRGAGPVRLVVRVPAGEELQVTEPVELGRLTWLAPKFTAAWLAIMLMGGIAFLVGAGRADRHSPEA
ncbi:hypothetical protein [Oleiharenicola sp. Vm1]|uniref:hypothetical protein n=1 Tax=Oleiharenicola sp. Vm1 TaxID=3398393 RepID=UPI0039F4E8C6